MESLFTHLKFPERYSEPIEKTLKLHGHSIRHPQELAQAVENLSDYFHGPDLRPTPWEQDDAAAAYIGYFFPLNYLRLQRVLQHAKALGFFEGLQHVIDFGSGPGTTNLALFDADIKFQSHQCVEIASKVSDMFARLTPDQNAKVSWSLELPKKLPSNTLFVSSYAMHEVGELPGVAFEADALMLIGPSNQKHSRGLMQLRSLLTEKGLHLWAPCLHQGPCPLLTHSKRDFCHERFHIDMPVWFKQMEKFLPMTNRTLTFSYLLASRRPPSHVAGQARVIGDTLVQKGKTMQMICRGEERELLSWLTRFGPAPLHPSGDLITLPAFEKRAHELRVVPNSTGAATD